MQDTDDLQQVLNRLADADVPEAALYRLSNLHGDELAMLIGAWPALPAERRQVLIARLVELGEADFETDFTELFRACLDDADPQVRISAIEGLWEVEHVNLVRPLVRILQDDPSIPVREAAAKSVSRYALLAELGRLPARLGQLVWDALWRAIHAPEEDLSVRRRAVESLAYFDRPEVTEVIEAAYRDEEPKMRVSAVFAMGRTTDQEWAEHVLAELETDDPEMRYEATRACGALRLIEATQELSQLVADLDLEVKMAAVWALGQIGTPEARRVLEICYEEGDEALQDAADEALAEMEFLQGEVDFTMYDFDEDDEDLLDWGPEEVLN